MWDDILKQKVPHKMSRGQIILKVCPFCSNSNYNIEVSTEKGVFHCWICNQAGIVKQLFKELDLKFEDDGLRVSKGQQPVQNFDDLSLDTFYPVKWERFKKFLASRGLEQADIARYNILTTDKGKFRGRVIFPLYEGSKLVYIVSRDTETKGRYYNINVNRSGILPYYLGTVDKTTVYLCEGTLDAISVHKLGYSAAILLGTILTPAQLRKLDTFGFKRVVVSLDGDAAEKAHKIYDSVTKHGLPAAMVLFDKKDDPNSVFVRDKAELKHALKNFREVSIKDKVCLKLKS
jgi:DNA primase